MSKTRLSIFYSNLATELRANGVAAEESSQAILVDDPRSWKTVIEALTKLGWHVRRCGGLAYARHGNDGHGVVLYYMYGLHIFFLHDPRPAIPTMSLPDFSFWRSTGISDTLDTAWLEVKRELEHKQFTIERVPHARVRLIRTAAHAGEIVALANEEFGTVTLIAI